MKKTTADVISQRREASRQFEASCRIEGIVPDSEDRADSALLIEGRMTFEEHRHHLIRKHAGNQ